MADEFPLVASIPYGTARILSNEVANEYFGKVIGPKYIGADTTLDVQDEMEEIFLPNDLFLLRGDAFLGSNPYQILALEKMGVFKDRGSHPIRLSDLENMKDFSFFGGENYVDIGLILSKSRWRESSNSQIGGKLSKELRDAHVGVNRKTSGIFLPYESLQLRRDSETPHRFNIGLKDGFQSYNAIDAESVGIKGPYYDGVIRAIFLPEKRSVELVPNLAYSTTAGRIMDVSLDTK